MKNGFGRTDLHSKKFQNRKICIVEKFVISTEATNGSEVEKPALSSLIDTHQQNGTT